MLDIIYAKMADSQFLIGMLMAVAAAATVLTLAMPLLQTDTLGKRMKSVASERERIRARERERLNKSTGNTRGSLRGEPKAYMRDIVDRFSLSQWLGTEKAKMQLAMAGFRGPQAETAFLFFRLVSPIVLAISAAFYIFVMSDLDWSITLKLGAVLLASYLGIKAPEIYLSNAIAKRKKSLGRSYPDTLDLLLICVESGMSIEHAFRKVSNEIGAQSVAMAEELTLTTAELSFLPDRRTAYENLSKRTGLESVRALMTVLVQAERYGTPLGTALRVLSQESRDARMTEAEKKAASLPPKLTVPMVLFFLPVLFIIIATPAAIQVMAASK